MRVRVYGEGYEEFGAVRYEAQWEQFTKAAQKRYDADPNFELDRDADIVFYYETFPTKKQALARARKAIKKGETVFGGATVTKQVVDWYVEEDNVAEWANTNEVEELP